MFLSVSMPVYNAAKYLDESVGSVMKQTEKDFELILVDDGSKDDSLAICEKWAAQYPDIVRVVKKPNSGSLFTRRRCLEESKGDYIYIMDADDMLLDENMFARIRAIFEKTHVDMVFFDATKNLETREKFFKFPFSDGQLFEPQDKRLINEYMLSAHGLQPMWTKIIRRELVDWDADYSPYTDVTNGTDLFQSLPIVANAQRLYFIDEALYYYRVEPNSGSIVHKFRPTVFVSGKRNFERTCEFAKNYGIPQPQLEKLLRSRAMNVITTSLYKARMIGPDDTTNKKDYIRSIGENEMFKEYYTLDGLNAPRKAMVLMLKMKLYGLLAALIR